MQHVYQGVILELNSPHVIRNFLSNLNNGDYLLTRYKQGRDTNRNGTIPLTITSGSPTNSRSLSKVLLPMVPSAFLLACPDSSVHGDPAQRPHARLRLLKQGRVLMLGLVAQPLVSIKGMLLEQGLCLLQGPQLNNLAHLGIVTPHQCLRRALPLHLARNKLLDDSTSNK